jgi:hypothetical protein
VKSEHIDSTIPTQVKSVKPECIDSTAPFTAKIKEIPDEETFIPAETAPVIGIGTRCLELSVETTTQ